MPETVTLREHLEALRRQDRRLAKERDRRYAEVNIEREKALKIKEAADERALELQAATQAYKDEKANELRSQIESERGGYATKDDLSALSDRFDAAHKPVVEFMAAQIASTGTAASNRTDTRLNINTIAQVLALLLSAVIVFAAFHH